jgi:hypothetical protein
MLKAFYIVWDEEKIEDNAENFIIPLSADEMNEEVTKL